MDDRSVSRRAQAKFLRLMLSLGTLDREAQLAELEAQLRDNEDRFRRLVENSLDAILITAPEGRILAANPAACRMFRGSEADLQAAGRNGLVDLDDPRLARAVEERARTGRFSGELAMHSSRVLEPVSEQAPMLAVMYKGDELSSSIGVVVSRW